MEVNFKKDIADVILPEAARIAQGRDMHVLRVMVRGTESMPVIEVVIDGAKGVAIEDCEAVSREVNTWLETTKAVRGNFRLDVLSPGLEEPLEFDWQFEKNMGRLVEVHYEDGGESHTVHGRLRGYSKTKVSIEPIHVKRRKGPKAGVDGVAAISSNGSSTASTNGATLEDAEVPIEAPLKEDEQLYNDEVALVEVDREKITKVVAQVDFSGKKE